MRIDLSANEKMPKGMKYWYIDEKTERWRIVDDAPTRAREEFEEFQKDLNLKPNEDGGNAVLIFVLLFPKGLLVR